MFFRQGLFSNESTNIFRQTVLYLYLELGKRVDIYPFCLLKFSLCYHPLLFTILIAGGDNFISQDLNVSTLKRDSRHNYKTLCLKIQVVYLKKTPCQRPPPPKKRRIILKALVKARRALTNGLEPCVRQIFVLTLLFVFSQLSPQTLMCNQDTNMLMI